MRIKVTNADTIIRRLQNVSINTIQNAWAETQYTAAEMEKHSYLTRPWTDRTGDARRSIYAYPRFTGRYLQIFHGIGVDYGKYLELCNGGKYRVIRPTTDRFRSVWIRNLKGILSK